MSDWGFIAARVVNSRLRLATRPAVLRTRGSRRFRTAAALVGMCAGVLAAEATRGDDVQRWIRQLGADGYEDRQAAHGRLLQRGPELLPQLREAAVQGDPEVRLRAAQLADRLREAQFQVLLQELTAHPERPAPETLPGWRRYAAIAGEDEAARALYAGMVRIAPDVMLQVETGDERLAASVQALIQTHFGAQPQSWGGQADEFSAERVGLLLLPAIEQSSVSQAIVPSRLSEWLGPVLLAGDANPTAAPLRRLAGAWVATPHTAPRSERMKLARQYGLEAGVAPAREVLLESRPATATTGRNGPTDSPQDVERQEAVLLLARFGGIEHLPDLEPLLADETEINVFQRRREIKFQTRLQDLALIALVHLTGQKPADYGFAAELTANAQTVYASQSVGFVTDAERQAALARWGRWRAVHLHSRRFPPLDAVEGVSL